MPESLFDSAHYRNVRRPALEAETLPAWCYSAEEFYAREVERIFRKRWNFLARADELARPGDYMSFELCGEPLVLVRGKDEKVRAFANTCRNRGTRLLSGRGSCRVITCPYHGWAYGLDGALIATPGMEETRNFARGDYGLLELRLESWAGFLFVNFDRTAPALAEQLGDLPALLASYDMAEMVCVRRREYELTCNWKIYLENAMEDYHTPTVHKGSIGKQLTEQLEARGDWRAIYLPAAETIALLPEDKAGAFPPIATLEGRAARGTYFVALYPSSFFATTQDCMWWLQEFPQGARRTRVSVGSCFPKRTVARADFAAKVEKYYRRWDTSLPEDNAISELQQAGLVSSLSRPGRLSSREPVVHDIANWVLDQVLD